MDDMTKLDRALERIITAGPFVLALWVVLFVWLQVR